jgi:hypothetical protein
MTERIVAAAIRLDNGEVISLPQPARHHSVLEYIRNTQQADYIKSDQQGFLTSSGQFVRRKPAAIIAFEAGQTDCIKNPLTSEDLW